MYPNEHLMARQPSRAWISFRRSALFANVGIISVMVVKIQETILHPMTYDESRVRRNAREHEDRLRHFRAGPPCETCACESIG